MVPFMKKPISYHDSAASGSQGEVRVILELHDFSHRLNCPPSPCPFPSRGSQFQCLRMCG